MEAFLERILEAREGNPFHHDLRAFLEPIRVADAWSSLVQVVLKVASPGVPDFFQGTEVWNLTLVDPDNRRPVDFAAIEALSGSIDRGLRKDPARAVEEMVSAPGDGRIKLHVTREALRCAAAVGPSSRRGTTSRWRPRGRAASTWSPSRGPPRRSR